jgi:Secretion system C-terminal sorting domain
LRNKSKFDSLRRFLPILVLTLFTALYANGQDSRTPNPDVMGKIVKLYPNPAISYITLELQKNYQKGLTVAVYNFLGKKMYESQAVSEKTTITLTDFTRGVYIYHLTDLSGKVIDTGKFQVSR